MNPSLAMAISMMVNALGQTEFPDIAEGGGIVDPETLVTVTFTDLGRRTRLTLHQSTFESDDARINHEGGWTGCLERFSTFIVQT